MIHACLRRFFTPRPRLILLVVAFALLSSHSALAQEACAGDHYREFDFWIGEWDLTNLRLLEDGEWHAVGEATNRVFPVAGGCGIVELWDGYLGESHIRGFSVRTYDSNTGKWHLVLNWPQPDRAGFGTLEGEFRHGRGDFLTESTAEDGSTQLTRYSFADIGDRTFRWNNGSSDDGGQSWQTNWIMEFVRRDRMANPLFNVSMFNTDEKPQCGAEVFRAADFLVGNWESTGPEGSKFRVEATPILDGCAVMEFIQGDNGTDAFTVVGYDARRGQWTMVHLDGGNGFDWFRGAAEETSIVLADDSGAERIRLVPGDGDTMTRVLGGNPINFVRR